MNIRPANMHLTHGLRGSIVDMSVSAASCIEDTLADSQMVRESGAGMDAPEDLPVGSVKAFFNESNGSKFCFGFCQRTTSRG